MNKLGKTIYNKILLQAEEAKYLSLNKLANHVVNSLGPMPREEDEKLLYSQQQLQDNIHQNLWKIALEVISYHDLQSVDIQKVDDLLVNLSNKVLASLEDNLEIEGQFGPGEEKLPGQK